MTEQRAEQIIVISLFVLLSSEVGNYLVTKQPKGGHLSPEHKKNLGRRIIGGFLTMFFASLTAVAAPEVGALLAVTVASYAFFHDGLPAINRNFPKEKATSPGTEKFPGVGPGPEFPVAPLGESSPISLIA